LFKIPSDQLKKKRTALNQISKEELSWQVRHPEAILAKRQGEPSASTSRTLALLTRKMLVVTD
jgi:hypothetical protein